MICKHIDHISIQTNDFEYAIWFYVELFGCKYKTAPFQYKDRNICFLDAGNIDIELYSAKSTGVQCNAYHNDRGGLDHIAFVVDDLRVFISRLQDHGIRVIKEPVLIDTHTDPVFLAFVEGPDSQEIELRQTRCSQ